MKTIIEKKLKKSHDECLPIMKFKSICLIKIKIDGDNGHQRLTYLWTSVDI